MSSDGFVAIVDTVCPRPYSLASLRANGLGGTEATVVRIAEAIDAQVFQHNRTESDGRYHPLAALSEPSALIVLRDPKATTALIERFPGVPSICWMHDLIDPGKDRAKRLASLRATLATAGAMLVGVSDFHCRQIEDAMQVDEPSASAPRVTRIYNPVDADLADLVTTDVDPDRMIFFSAPAKGLDYALFTLGAIRRRWPHMRLVVANPAYAAVGASRHDGVIDLGSLPQRDVLAQVAGSLCTYCTNFEYPETFGLVLAESNAVGTPAVAHPIGAATEVLNDARQVLDTPALATLAYRASRRFGTARDAARRTVDAMHGFDAYLDVIERWRDGGRPVVRARPAFALDAIAAEWRALLRTAPAFPSSSA